MAKTFILKDLAEHEKITISALNTKLGLSNGTIASAIRRNANISAFIEKKILHHYPNINPQWLESATLPIFQETGSSAGSAATGTTDINIVTFLTRYREGIKAATGTTLSLKTLSEKLGHGITMENILKWEKHKNVPAKEEHRRALRQYFNIENLDVIPISHLQHAISCWPHPIKKQTRDYTEQPPALPVVMEESIQYLSEKTVTEYSPKDYDDMTLLNIAISNKDATLALKDIARSNLLLTEMIHNKMAGNIPNAQAM